jgi:hypothetical protein
MPTLTRSSTTSDAIDRNLDEEIRIRAYELYERRGRQDGHDLEDWLEAESEIVGVTEMKAAA